MQGFFIKKEGMKFSYTLTFYFSLGPAATTSASIFVYFLKFSTKLEASF